MTSKTTSTSKTAAASLAEASTATKSALTQLPITATTSKIPYIIIKYGGNAMGNTEDLTQFAHSIADLCNHGYWPVIIHGGGPHISTFLSTLGISSQFVHGYRISTPEIVQAAQMVLTGQVAPALVSALAEQRLSAITLAGVDANLYTVKKYQPIVDGKALDIGYVGDITTVNTTVIDQLRSAKIIPVISSIGPDSNGELYNINADSAAGAIAGALKAYALMMLTNVTGIYRNWPERHSLISKMYTHELEELLPSINTGMVPKIRGCLTALNQGVLRAHIIDASKNHDFVSIIESPTPAGTLIVSDNAKTSTVSG